MMLKRYGNFLIKLTLFAALVFAHVAESIANTNQKDEAVVQVYAARTARQTESYRASKNCGSICQTFCGTVNRVTSERIFVTIPCFSSK